MKILICVSSLYGGGAERVASLWINGFYHRNHEVSVILSNGLLPRAYNIPDEVPVYNIGSTINNRLVQAINSRITQKFKLHRIIAKIKPDVVITVFSTWGPMLEGLRKRYGFKMIATDHNAYERPENAPMPKALYQNKFVDNKSFDAVTVLTTPDKHILDKYIKRVFVLPNPLAFEIKGLNKNKDKTILSVGSIDRWYVKGFDVLIKAWGALSNNYNDWKLQIVGEGSWSNMDYLQGIVSEYCRPNSVEFCKYTPDLQSYYENASIFCLSSRYEGFGMVLIESMCFGCACIACDYKGRQREIIDDRLNGLICQPDNVDQMAKKISTLIEDDALRGYLQVNAIEKAKMYNLNTIMDKWNDILEIVCK